MTDDRARKNVSTELPDEALSNASPSADRTDVSLYPELQRWLDEAQTPHHPERYNFFTVVDVLPYILGMLGFLAFALLAGWALQNLP